MADITSHDGLSAAERHRIAQLAANYKLTPATMAVKLDPSWIPAPHLRLISKVVARAVARGNGRIIISLPPRHGKSYLCNNFMPVWYLENYHKRNIITATYGQELSTDFTRGVRDLINENQELLDVRIRKDASRVDNFLTNFGGSIRGMGLGGSIMGRGAHLFLIDDYIKTYQEALSAAHREFIWNWFITTPMTRLEPGATMIIIATRWHADDLIGRILLQEGHKWEYIRIPAIAEEDDPLGRLKGEALFPERYDVSALMERKELMGSVWFNAVFQQDPKSEEDSITDSNWINTVKYEQVPMDRLKLARCWDLAGSYGKGDWTVGALVGFDQQMKHTYILNILRKQLSSNGVRQLVRATAIADGTNVPVYIEQEPGASGKDVIDIYTNAVLPEFQVSGVRVDEKKQVRAQPFLAAAEASKVSMVVASWNKAFVDEFDEFPNGKHDDQIDAVSTGYTKTAGIKVTSPLWGRRTNMIRQEQHTTSGIVSGVTFGRR